MQEIQEYFKGLTPIQIRQLNFLKPLYEEWNAKINVISRKDLEAFYIHHILHSLSIAKVVEFKNGSSILDVGTGGGFPAIPLAILFPQVRFVAVDSIGKKIKVVNEIIKELELKNISGLNKRAEEVEGKFDFIISRAVTRTKHFIPWVQNKFKDTSFNSKPNGFLFLKGGDLKEELEETKREFEQYRIRDFFSDGFFETKSVVYMPYQKL